MSDIGVLAKGFIGVLEKRHLHYNHKKLMGVNDQITVKFSGNQIPEITINFIFNEDNGELQIRVIDIIPRINGNRMEFALQTVNEFNTEYNFGKFCITTNNDLEFRIDALVDQNCSAAFCFELMRKTLKICDESYLDLANL
jgi:hypothetical protein